MKSIPSCFVVILLHLRMVKCQRFTGTEILTSMEPATDLNKFSKSSEIEECLPAIEGKLYPDVPYLFMSCDTNQDLKSLRNFPSETHCTGFQCWESQLTDSSRFDILYIINMFRTSVAEGTCGPRCEKRYSRAVFELNWYNLLEHKAISLMANCEDKKGTSFSDEILYKNKSSWIDHVAVSFQVKEGLQREMRLVLRTLLAENYLNDWDEKTHLFRRGLAIDVGCAYILRYGVTMVTTLNETVNFGNVGHLCCVFASPATPSTLYDTNSSSASCASVLPGFDAEIPFENYLHRSLCKVTPPLSSVTTPTTSCQFDSKFHENIFDNICPQESSGQFYETWNEKPYGLFLRFHVELNNQNEVTSTLQSAECNVPKFPPPSSRENNQLYNYNCTYKHEVVNDADSSACQGWSCDDSQLTDYSRHFLWQSMNVDRELVAQGFCTSACKPPCLCQGIQYCNMAELRWHWYLEWKATEEIKNCPSENSFHKVTYLNSPFLEPVFFEKVTLVFDLGPEGQITLADRLSELFWTNELNDWESDGTFRRGNAMWFGCAIVVRPLQTIKILPKFKLPDGIPTHMVCIYASLEEDFVSKRGFANMSCCPTCIPSATAVPCRINMVKGVQPYPDLCRSTFTLEMTMSCNINKCEKSSEKYTSFLSAWSGHIPGFTLVQGVDGTIHKEERLTADELAQLTFARKICIIAFLLFGVAAIMVLLLVSLLYKHDLEEKYYMKLKKDQKQSNLHSQ